MTFHIMLQVISAYFATLFFGILFEIPRGKLLSTGVGGAICWLIYSILHEGGLSVVISTFIASLFASSYAEYMARIHKTPVTIYLVAAIIPLVPGAGMYNMMLAAIQQRFNESTALGAETLQTAGVIAVAIVIVSSMTKIISTTRSGLK